jgi:hypothetical protein
MTASRTRQLPSVRAELALVVTGADHFAAVNDHRADRDVVVFEGSRRLAQGQAHEVLIAGKEVRAHDRATLPLWRETLALRQLS